MDKIWRTLIFCLAVTEVMLESNTKGDLLSRLTRNPKLVENVQPNANDEVSSRLLIPVLRGIVKCGAKLLSGWGCGGCDSSCGSGGWDGPSRRGWSEPDDEGDVDWGGGGGQGGNGRRGYPLAKIDFGAAITRSKWNGNCGGCGGNCGGGCRERKEIGFNIEIG